MASICSTKLETSARMDQVFEDHKPTVDYKQLTSYLESDNSLLTPWNRNPSGPAACDSKSSLETTNQEYLTFQPGSFFSRGYEDELVVVRDDDHQYTYYNEFTAITLRVRDYDLE